MAEPKLSIKQMKESIRAAGLPTADLLERADIDARYAEAVGRLAEAEQLKTGEKLAKRARTEPAERDWRATAWASPAAVLDACLDDAPLALADIPAKLPWKVGA